ncbi:MAG: sdhB [Firmicutes bacterium]|nr:sdhB [Bacillota bacterium]
MAASNKNIFVKIVRFNPTVDREPRLQEYQVESVEPMSINSVLARILDQDSTLAFRRSSCFKGRCGACILRVNGKDVLGCLTMVSPGETVTLEPYPRYSLIRDLVVDFSQPLHLENERV